MDQLLYSYTLQRPIGWDSDWKWCRIWVPLFANTTYLHHWLSVTIHFNRYDLCFDKYTECRDKCKPLYFIALHICVVPSSFSHFVECPLSDSTCWMIGNFRMDVTERLLNTKVVLFLEFLRFAVDFLRYNYLICLIHLKKCSAMSGIHWKKCNEAELFAWKNVWA